MAAYITVGAKTSHGGTVITGSPHTTHNGIPIARIGDKVMCKKCKKITTIVSGDPAFVVDGAPIARGGDATSCGAKLIATQQSFVESGFDVMGIEPPEPLQFPKSDMLRNNLTNKSSDFSILDVYVNNDWFTPFGIKPRNHTPVPTQGPQSLGRDPDTYDKIHIKVKINSGTFKNFKLDVIDKTQPSASKSGTFSEGDIVTLEWDGFIGDIYSTRALLAGVNLKVHATDTSTNSTVSKTKKATFKRKDKDWIDIDIDRKSKKINVNLRISLSPLKWNSLSPKVVNSKDLKPKKPMITQYNMSKYLTDSDVHILVKEAMSRFWSRSHNTINGKKIDVDIGGDKFQVTTKCEITDSRSMPKLDVIFNTNRASARSRNWEASRIVFYNTGYIHNGTRWKYKKKSDSAEDFKRVFAHEIGHDLLLANGGHTYSKTHKGSSHIWQSANGTYTFAGNEYDLMKYSQEDFFPPDYFDKVVASEEDVRGLLAICKLTL